MTESGSEQVERLSDDDDLEGGVDTWHAHQHLERSDEIERCQTGIKDDAIFLVSVVIVPHPRFVARFVDWEGEHHSALVVFGDVAVRHPHTGIRHVEEDVDGLVRTDEDRVLPNQILLGQMISGEHEEARNGGAGIQPVGVVPMPRRSPGGSAPNDTGFANGEPVNPESISQLFDRKTLSSGLPRTRLHDLRHHHSWPLANPSRSCPNASVMPIPASRWRPTNTCSLGWAQPPQPTSPP